MNEEFNKKIREEALFLVSSSKNYLEKLNIFLQRLNIEEFLKTLQQLHRALGEILGLTKYMQENFDVFRDFYYQIMHEMQDILKDMFDITEAFINELKKRLNSFSRQNS